MEQLTILINMFLAADNVTKAAYIFGGLISGSFLLMGISKK